MRKSTLLVGAALALGLAAGCSKSEDEKLPDAATKGGNSRPLSEVGGGGATQIGGTPTQATESQ